MQGEADCEPDLPSLPCSSEPGIAPTLPPRANNFHVLLLDRGGGKRHMLSTTRIPFWVAAVDGSGLQRAAVMYVGSR